MASPHINAWLIHSRFAVLALLFATMAAPPTQADTSSATQAAERPNIVLIFTDDQGYQDIGCFGSPNIRTPNLDQMAAEGRRFTDFYVAAPVCSASRAALMTGCYPLRVGITGVLFPKHNVGLNPEETTIADLLRSVGYATACVGKWHLGHRSRFLPTNNGFDSYFGIPYSNDMDPVPGKARNLDNAWREKDPTPWNVPLMEDTSELERPAQQSTLTRRYTERAVRFIEQNQERPFFLYLAHTMPHIPLFVSPENYVEDPKQAYQATIEEIDWSVGQILEALQRTGVAGDTLVVYTSDNGPWLGMKHHGGSALPLRDGKFSTFEGGMRVPCIMRYPARIEAGTECAEVAATIDLLPTFAKLAGASLPANVPIDGLDISELLFRDGASTPHDAYYFYRGENLQAVRSDKWKLRLPQGKNGRPKLHDLHADISETTDVAQQQQEIVQRLTAQARVFDEQLREGLRTVGTLETEYASRHLPRNGPRIVFLGDSITAGGRYIDYAETAILLDGRRNRPWLINLGLSSETVSGLSEPHHPFPRPDLHDRLSRVLDTIRPQYVVACYGINDGIYHPWSDERFMAYQQGIQQLVKMSRTVGAKVILMTPPPYAGQVSDKQEPADGKDFGYRTPYAQYDDVMARYAEWILSLEGEGVRVADLRSALLPHISQAYGKDPIHPNAFGHEVMGNLFLEAWDAETKSKSRKAADEADPPQWSQLVELVHNRRQAYDKALLQSLGHGHPRKQGKHGLSEAISIAQQLDARISELLAE